MHRHSEASDASRSNNVDLHTVTSARPCSQEKDHTSEVASIADTTESYPSRCESPLLPMGQGAACRIDPDRLSQQLGKHGNRQSQYSMVYKNYDIHDDEDDDTQNRIEEVSGKHPRSATMAGSSLRGSKHGLLPSGTLSRYQMRRPRTLIGSKTYRNDGSCNGGGSSLSAAGAAVGQTSPVRELSSKLKSACRKLNPKRLTRHGHHHQADHASSAGAPADPSHDAISTDTMEFVSAFARDRAVK
ncbi:hypothetical protein LPJ66_009715 [Kickxella alabastrina]|uniref:Uncharacterized protein n=1 Tax=Kickxella alabastrina TaxID=61397 RepID=A0ACC1I695_9FUNG|nr:hypothetical protein LPJ66_009715 [Kickxella alabastrina]